ncbi:MAG: sterol desaturase family protein [Microthrixaceae bacterium]
MVDGIPSGALRRTGPVLAGFGIWTLVEYLGHRFVMHGRLPPRFIAAEHGRHHADPDGLELAVSLGYNAAGGLTCWAGALVVRTVVGRDVSGPVSGFVAGAFAYSIRHWSIHARMGQDDSAIDSPHGIHHFEDPTANFGFTTTVWDRCFGTYRRARSSADS